MMPHTKYGGEKMKRFALCHTFFIVVVAISPHILVSLTLPPVEYADTETSTNVAFTVAESGAGRFTFSLSCITTPSNNVEAAFGYDSSLDGVSYTWRDMFVERTFDDACGGVL